MSGPDDNEAWPLPLKALAFTLMMKKTLEKRSRLYIRQDWKDRPSYSSTDSGNAVTIEVEDDDANILQVHINMILGLVQIDKAISFYLRQLLLVHVAEQNLQDKLELIFIYQSFLLTWCIIGQLFMDMSSNHPLSEKG